MPGTVRGVIAVLTLICLGGGSVFAQEAPNLEAAKQAFKAGQEFMGMERYADAVVEFKKAYAITGDGLVMGQVALAYEKGGDYEAALGALRTYQEALPEADRASVRPLVAKYEKLIAEGKSTPLVLPGEQAQPHEPAEAGGALQGDVSDSAPVEEESPLGGNRLWTWVAAGTAAALGLSSLVVGLSAQSKYDELNDRCGSRAAGICSQGDVDSVRTRAIVTDVLWGTALVAGVAAVVLYFIEGEQTAAERAPSPMDGPVDEEDEDALVKDFRLTPVAGASGAGMGAAFNF